MIEDSPWLMKIQTLRILAISRVYAQGGTL